MLVDVLVKDNKHYTYENHACRHVQRVFNALDIRSRKIAMTEGIFQDYMRLLEDEPPQWTMTFDEIFPLQKPFCDIVKIPNFYWQNGFFFTAFFHVQSQYGKVGCFDRKIAHHFSQPFIPHPCENDLTKKKEETFFDLVLFQDLIDIDNKKNTWKTIFGSSGALQLLEAVEICKKNPDLHPVTLTCFKNEGMPFCDMTYELEEYLRAERTLALIESIENVRIDVFGEHVGNNWLLRLKNRENVRLHALLPYTERFEVLKRTKVLIRDQPPFFDGGDEWILHALNAGCSVFTNPNPYLSEVFKEVDCFYHTYEELNEKIQWALKGGKPSFPQQVLAQNCWEKRVSEIVQYMAGR